MVILASLAGFLLSIIPCPQAKADSRDAYGAIGLGAALVAGVCGIAYACTPSYEDLDRNAGAMVSQARANYSSILGCSYDSSEASVYDIAMRFFRAHQGSYDSYCYNLDSSIRDLQKHCSGLNNSRSKIRSKSKYAYIYQKMGKTVADLEKMISELTCFYKYLTTHKAYFKLYQCEDLIMNYYQKELEFIGYDLLTLESVLKSAVIKRRPTDHQGYAYEQYLSGVAGDIAALQGFIYNAQSYPNRVAWANELLSKLSNIERVIIASPDYARAKADYQFWLQEQARLEAERARARAEQERARLERERLYAQQERNRLEAERNRIERNRLYEMQQRPVVYVYPEPSAPPVDIHVHF